MENPVKRQVNLRFSAKFGNMTYVLRLIQKKLEKTLQRGKSVLLLAPRQTGKTTLLHQLEAVPWQELPLIVEEFFQKDGH